MVHRIAYPRPRQVIRVERLLYFGLRRLLAIFHLVLGSKLGCEFRVAEEALRFRSIVFFAPITLLLEVRCQLGIALSTNVLRYAMLDAPVDSDLGNRFRGLLVYRRVGFSTT
jgi:hypothetical protein